SVPTRTGSVTGSGSVATSQNGHANTASTQSASKLASINALIQKNKNDDAYGWMNTEIDFKPEKDKNKEKEKDKSKLPEQENSGKSDVDIHSNEDRDHDQDSDVHSAPE
ncbi:hypothetical protein RFI_33345, partial [Reticulomyxa filosa]